MKLPLYNQKGEKKSSITLSGELFEISAKPALVSQAVTAYLSNQRKAKALTKTRGEVSGGGRKPWKQKGTGRARAGSTRSPLWRGGGITFGPTGKENYQKKLPQKMRRLAILSALSYKVKNKELIVLDKIELPHFKTRDLENIFQRLPIKEGKILLILDKGNKKVQISGRNFPYLKIATPSNLDVYNLLNADAVIVTKNVLEEISKIYHKNKLNLKKAEPNDSQKFKN